MKYLKVMANFMIQIEAEIFAETQISLFSDSNSTDTRYKDPGPLGHLPNGKKAQSRNWFNSRQYRICERTEEHTLAGFWAGFILTSQLRLKWQSEMN